MQRIDGQKLYIERLVRRSFQKPVKSSAQMMDLREITNSCEKKRSKKQRRKGKIFPFECRVPKISKER